MGLCSNLAISCISVTSSKNGDDDDSDKDNVNDNRLLDLHVMLTNNCMEMVLLSKRTWCNNNIISLKDFCVNEMVDQSYLLESHLFSSENSPCYQVVGRSKDHYGSLELDSDIIRT